MKKLTRMMALLMVLCMTVALTACSSQTTLKDIEKKGKIVMATNAEFEPFEYWDGDKIVGIDVDIAQKIAEKIGVELEVSDMEFESVIVAVKSGKADFGVAGMTVNPTRLKSVDFSNTYFGAFQSVIVLPGSDIAAKEDLEGKTLGVQTGTTGDTYCTEEVPGATVSRFDKGADAVQALLSGKIDAVVIDDFPATKYLERNEGKIVKLDLSLTEKEEYAICVNKGNKEILDKINEVLAEMKQSGELDEIVEKYISAD